jgi:hypothetical protein
VNEIAIVMAKLSGIRKTVMALLDEKVIWVGGSRTRLTFGPDDVQHFFIQAATHLETLRQVLPDYYGDFRSIDVEPSVDMSNDSRGRPTPSLAVFLPAAPFWNWLTDRRRLQRRQVRRHCRNVGSISQTRNARR